MIREKLVCYNRPACVYRTLLDRNLPPDHLFWVEEFHHQLNFLTFLTSPQFPSFSTFLTPWFHLSALSFRFSYVWCKLRAFPFVGHQFSVMTVWLCVDTAWSAMNVIRSVTEAFVFGDCITHAWSNVKKSSQYAMKCKKLTNSWSGSSKRKLYFFSNRFSRSNSFSSSSILTISS